MIICTNQRLFTPGIHPCRSFLKLESLKSILLLVYVSMHHHHLKYLLTNSLTIYTGDNIISRRLCSNFNLEKMKGHLLKYPGGSVDLEKNDKSGIAMVCLNHPAKKNAFSGKMMADFSDIVTELEGWNKGKAVLVYGADETFCSGGDLDLMRSLLSEDKGGMKMSIFMHDVLTRLWRLPLVSAAFLQGKVLGGGAEVATACDLRISTQLVSIGFVQKKMGLTCGWGSGTRLVELLGRTRTLELLVSGKIFGYQEASEINFVNAVIPDGEQSVQKARNWLEEFTKGDRDVIRATKLMVSQIADYEIKTLLQKENLVFDSVWGKKAQLEALERGTKHK